MYTTPFPIHIAVCVSINTPSTYACPVDFAGHPCYQYRPRPMYGLFYQQRIRRYLRQAAVPKVNESQQDRSLEAEFFVHSVFCISNQRVIPSGRQIRFSIDSSRFPHPLTLQCNEYLKAELSFFFFVEQPSVSVTLTPVNYTYMQLISRDFLCPL